MHHTTKHQLIYIALIILLPFILFWRWALKGEVLYWGTLLLQFWPWHTLVKISLLNGAWPLWNPLLGNGTPLLANLQSAVFYPPNLIYLALPVEHALTLSIILHFILAGVLMYFYVRHLGVRPFAATVSALAYMFSGYILGRSQFVPMVNAAAWFPLLLLLSDKLIARSGGIQIIWLALLLAVQLLAGHAQLWFYGLWLLGAYVVFRSWTITSALDTLHVSRFTSVIKTIGFLALAVGLALLISAAQILPTAEFVQQSLRSAGVERTFALTYSFWPWRLITLLAPNFFGHPAQGNYWGYANYWEDHAYAGVLPFILALVAVWHYIKTTLIVRAKPAPSPALAGLMQVVPFFAALIPLTLILAMGWNTPIYLWVFNTIPGFSFFQAPARLLIWYALALAVLAGLGAEQFQLTPQNRRFWRRLLAACIALTVAGFAAGFFIAGRNLTFLTATRQAGILLILSIVLLLLKPKDEVITRNAVWQWIVIIFISLDLLLAGWPLLPTLPATLYTQPIADAEFIKAQSGNYRFFTDEKFAYNTTFSRFFRFKDFGPPELKYWMALKETLIPNFGVYTELPAANNDDPLVVGRWKQLTNVIAKGDAPLQARLLALMNVGYFVGPAQNTWPTVYSAESFVIQTVPDPLPRVYFVPQAHYVKDRAEAMAALTTPNFDPRREVVIMGQDISESSPAAASPRADLQPIALQEMGPGQLQIQLTASSSGFLVLTDTFYPGWQATVDNQPAEILLANLAFRAVAIEAGPHKIGFHYQPLSFTIGLWTSLITCSIIMVTIGIWAARRLQNKNQT